MNLQSLRKALKPLTEFGTEEITFALPHDEDEESTAVTLRPLLPKEEIAAQQHAAAILVQTQEDEGLGDDDPLTKAAALRYFDQFRTEILSYALVQVGDNDLRDVEYIETGEFLEDGVTPVRIKRQLAVRQIIEDSWSRGVITIAFAKYGDLITKIAERADKIAQESLSDLEAEYERIVNRKRHLEEELQRRAKGDPSVTVQQIKALVSAGDALEREVDQAIEIARSDRLEAERIMKDAQESAEQEPAPAPAPAPEPEPAPAPEPEAPTPDAAPPRQSVIPPTAPPPSPRVRPNPDFVSSFADPEEDPNALAAEAARIAAAQKAAAQNARKDLGDPLAAAQPLGDVQGPDGKPIPAFKLPSETVSRRGEKSAPEAPRGGKGARNKGRTDPDPSRGSVNPHFRKPGK
jgi:hypothetical protein